MVYAIEQRTLLKKNIYIYVYSTGMCWLEYRPKLLYDFLILISKQQSHDLINRLVKANNLYQPFQVFTSGSHSFKRTDTGSTYIVLYFESKSFEFQTSVANANAVLL
jgi:hypothetical protein